MESIDLNHNGFQFDFFEFFDMVVNSSATTTEKLMALCTGRHIGRNGEAAFPKRSRIMEQASCSENTFQRSLSAMRLFFEVEKRSGRSTLYRPKPSITTSDIDKAIANLRKKSTPQNGAPQNSTPQNGRGGTPQNGVGVHPKMGQGPHPKMGRHKKPLKEPLKEPIKDVSPDGDLSSGQFALTPDDGPMTASKAARIAFGLYNETALKCGLPKARLLDKDRAKSLALRVKDAGGIDGFKQALENIEKSAFLQGKTNHSFRADLNFVCQRSSFIRLFEGGYGNGLHADKPANPQGDYSYGKYTGKVI